MAPHLRPGSYLPVMSEISDSRERYALRLTALAKCRGDGANRSRARLLAHDLTLTCCLTSMARTIGGCEIYGEMLVACRNTHICRPYQLREMTAGLSSPSFPASCGGTQIGG